MPYAHEEFEYAIDGRDVIVEFYVVPGDPGVKRYSNGDPGYPPLADHVEIVKVYYNPSGIEVPNLIFQQFYKELDRECWNVIKAKLKEPI